MEFLKEYLALFTAFMIGVGAYFQIKSDRRSDVERITRLEDEKEKTLANAQDIRELQMQQVATQEHRHTLNRLLEKQDDKMEKMDHKMDEMLKGITAVATKLQERTKELHS